MDMGDFEERDYRVFELFRKRWALGIMGSRSGRDGGKAAVAGLTPVGLGGSVTFEEASLTLVCRKVYQHRMSKDGMAPDIRDYYASKPGKALY